MHLRPRRHHDEAGAAGDLRLRGIGRDRAHRRRVDPHRGLALHVQRLAFVPVEAGDTHGTAVAHELLVHLGRRDRFRAVGVELAGLVDRVDAVAQQEARPDRRVRVLEPARDEAAHAVRGIVAAWPPPRRSAGNVVGHRDALLLEEVLVEHQDVVVERHRQRVDAAVGLRAGLDRRLREVGEVEVGRGERLVGDQRAQVGQPLAAAEQPLLRRLRDVAGVEARLAGRELDRELLPVLLLGNLLGADLDAGERRELGLVLLQHVVERALLQRDLDLLALEALPVEAASARTRGEATSPPASASPDCSTSRRLRRTGPSSLSLMSFLLSHAWPRRNLAPCSWNCCTVIFLLSVSCQYGGILSWKFAQFFW